MLQDKVVLITGAAGGIGQALAKACAERGALLVLTDINLQALQANAANPNLDSEGLLLIRHDVRDSHSWEKVIHQAVSRFRRLDILINNAGIVEPGAVDKLSLEKIQRQIEVNFLGTILGCRAVIPGFKRQGCGHIVNMASLGGIVPMPGEAVYSATKFGIRGFSHALRAELAGTGISVSVICPDSVATPQLAYELQHEEALLSFVSSPLSPDEVAKAVLRTLRKRRAESLVPRLDGCLIRLAMAVPALFHLALPLLKSLARRRRAHLLSSEKGQTGRVDHVNG
jgi:short-subunit dehydrogenase